MKIFTTICLSSGQNINIAEVTDGHVMMAAIGLNKQEVTALNNGNSLPLTYHLASVVSCIGDNPVGIGYIKSLGICDLNMIIEAMMVQGVKLKL